MAEHERLEARLTDLRRAVEWPPTPRLAPAIRRRLARRRRRRVVLALIAAALAIAVAGGAATAAYLELRGATIQQVPRLPSPTAPPNGPAAYRLDLGQRQASLDAAAKAAGFQPLVPASLGQPDEVYYRTDPGVVTLLYRPRPDLPATSDPDVGALVMEARATVDRSSFGKLMAPANQVRPVQVNGGPGFWISGAPHAFFFYSSGSGGRTDSLRLAGDALIWNQAGLVVRIESGLDERRTLEVAGTVRRPAV